MLAEIGVFALILSALFALLLIVIPSLGLRFANPAWIQAAPLYVLSQFICIVIAYVCLTGCFLTNDFSLIYVLSNSSLALPWFYKLCAVWGGHEGSMLLWIAILSFWMLAISLFCSSLAKSLYTRALIVLGGISFGLLSFLLSTSNPFARQFEVLNTAGRDLNPLLQDPGFLFHPPMLYMGYVGFSVAFAFAIASLWEGRIDPQFAKWTRPWTLAAWCCLTAGITLGSWWAYRELGWGGWWFWDPVENASFMPWLVGTALLHSLAVSEQRQQFQAWTLLLAITAFSLSLLGTFLVRSGVLTSVHAFAVDPKRGLYILCLLLLVSGGSLLIFALRSRVLQPTLLKPALFSRENALLLNNIFLMVIMLTVLLGTIYPLLIDGLKLGKLSVGAPYFNTVFLPLMLPILLFMGVGIHLNWQQDNLLKTLSRLYKPALAALLLSALVLYVAYTINLYASVGLSLALWIILSTAKLIMIRGQQRGFLHLGQAFCGMIMAHFGVAMTVMGIVISTNYGVEQDVKMAPGGEAKLAGYNIKFLQESALTGPNYHGTQAQFEVSRGNAHKIISPEKRRYDVAHLTMTESAIDVNPFRDIYVALGESLGAQEWTVRLYYKPLVRWIWMGGFMILLGGVLSMTDRRYYKRVGNPP